MEKISLASHLNTHTISQPGVLGIVASPDSSFFLFSSLSSFRESKMDNALFMRSLDNLQTRVEDPHASESKEYCITLPPLKFPKTLSPGPGTPELMIDNDIDPATSAKNQNTSPETPPNSSAFLSILDIAILNNMVIPAPVVPPLYPVRMLRCHLCQAEYFQKYRLLFHLYAEHKAMHFGTDPIDVCHKCESGFQRTKDSQPRHL